MNDSGHLDHARTPSHIERIDKMKLAKHDGNSLDFFYDLCLHRPGKLSE